MLQESTEQALQAVPTLLERRSRHESEVLYETGDTSVDWKVRVCSDVPWMVSHLGDTFSETRLDWRTLYYFLSSLDYHSESLSAAPVITAPSLRNRIRISRRISALVSDLWRREFVRQNENAKLPLWRRECFTIGMSSRGYKELFFDTSKNGLSLDIQGFLRPNGLLAGILFENTNVIPGAPSRILGSKSSYLGARVQNCLLKNSQRQSSDEKVICSIVVSVEKRDSYIGDNEDYLGGVVGLKVRCFEESRRSQQRLSIRLVRVQ